MCCSQIFLSPERGYALYLYWYISKTAPKGVLLSHIPWTGDCHMYASAVTQLSKLRGETLTSIWYFRKIFMHQYSLKSHWQPWVCSWTRYTSRFSGPLPWVYNHQERLFRRKVSFCSYRMFRLLREKEKNLMDFWLWTLWCLKEVLDHRDIVWPKGCYQMIKAF